MPATHPPFFHPMFAIMLILMGIWVSLLGLKDLPFEVEGREGDMSTAIIVEGMLLGPLRDDGVNSHCHLRPHAPPNMTGAIPGVGIAPDVLNAAIYHFEGDKTNRNISIAAATLGAAGTIAVVARNINKVGNAVEAAVKQGDEVAGGGGITTLHRAVGPAELADIKATGQLRAGPGMMEGKWFAENADHAAKWGEIMDFGGKPTVIQADFPSSTVDNMFRVDKLDGIGPARYAEEAQFGDCCAIRVPE